MKIIHTSDLHLNSKIDKLSTEKARQRRDELIFTFERLIDYAKAENVRAIIISGDMFDTSKINAKVFDRVLFAIENAESIDFLYVAGNHEEDSFVSYIEKKPNNLFIFGETWQYKRYQNVVVCGINLDKSNQNVVYDLLELNKDDVNIVAMHGQVADYKNNSTAEIISLPLLREKNVDYLALGHYHSFADGVIDNRGKFVYSGCLEGRGFDETGEKGFVLIDTDNKLSYKFIPFSKRNLYEEKFDVSTYSTNNLLREEIVGELKRKYVGDSLVKVVLFGSHTADFDIDIEGLNTKLNDYFYFAKVSDETVLKISLKDYETDKSFKGEFVRSVLSDGELSEEDRNAVIMTGLKAIKGEL